MNYLDNNIVKYEEKTNTCHITLNDISNDKSYLQLINTIQLQYDNKNYFNLEIDTINLEPKKIKMKYLYDLSCFLKQLKNEETTYLTKSKIFVYDEFTNYLLYTLFTFMSKPIAPVHVLLFKNRSGDLSGENIEKYNTYYP